MIKEEGKNNYFHNIVTVLRRAARRMKRTGGPSLLTGQVFPVSQAPLSISAASAEMHCQSSLSIKRCLEENDRCIAPSPVCFANNKNVGHWAKKRLSQLLGGVTRPLQSSFHFLELDGNIQDPPEHLNDRDLGSSLCFCLLHKLLSSASCRQKASKRDAQRWDQNGTPKFYIKQRLLNFCF